MEIHASSRYDRKSVAALCRMFRTKKTKPATAFVLTMLGYAVLTAIAVLLVCLSPDAFHFAVLTICLLALLVDTVVFFVLPRIQYRNLANLREAENRFVFRETDFTATTEGKGQSAEAELAYDTLVRVVETKAYLFIFRAKNSAFIVDRETLSDADMQELRRRMAYCLGKRYSIYRY
ncbi:MAG: YcxB family protein [Clostridia bacterium]|nr:YcxB family protein [Clostridia bacterium]